MVLDFYFSLIAACEFLSGTKKQAEELGTRWIDEIKEEFTFAILCRGDTKVIYHLKKLSRRNQLIMMYVAGSLIFHVCFYVFSECQETTK